jgi:hypothetical protein
MQAVYSFPYVNFTIDRRSSHFGDLCQPHSAERTDRTGAAWDGLGCPVLGSTSPQTGRLQRSFERRGHLAKGGNIHGHEAGSCDTQGEHITGSLPDH